MRSAALVAVMVLAWTEVAPAAPLETPVVQMPVLLSGEGDLVVEANPVFISARWSSSSPRLKKRGPIEAVYAVRTSFVQASSPRLKKRGPIEATTVTFTLVP